MATQDVRLTVLADDGNVYPVLGTTKGELKLEEPLVVEGPPGEQGEKGEKGEKGDPGDPFSGNFADDVTFDGNADFAGSISGASWDASGGTGTGYFLGASGNIRVRRSDTSSNTDELFVGYKGDGNPVAEIKADGSVMFAIKKAGFTAEGYLWCTTRRGDTVMLDATSNGLASWVPYTPPNRLTELQDKWSEKNAIRPMPEESSLDEPETPQ